MLLFLDDALGFLEFRLRVFRGHMLAPFSGLQEGPDGGFRLASEPHLFYSFVGSPFVRPVALFLNGLIGMLRQLRRFLRGFVLALNSGEMLTFSPLGRIRSSAVW
jgi:hypothetical protein